MQKRQTARAAPATRTIEPRLLEAPEDERSVGPPEPERIGKSMFNEHGTGCARNIVEIAAITGDREVHRRRCDLVLDAEHGESRLQCSSGAQQMPGG